MTAGRTLQTHCAYTPSPRHFHSHYLHNLHNRGGTPGLECASGVFRGVHHNLGKVTVLEFSILFSLEASERPSTTICVALLLQLCSNTREHLDGDIVPGHAGEAPIEHILHPFLIRL